ncbi:MAG: twin-arginine translocation signal domain-containing protein [Eggerthellaceae bacterium]|nr:twin-arginine translocation signal domain-containing protein [Eggerthellaceae bacterium]
MITRRNFLKMAGTTAQNDRAAAASAVDAWLG